MRKKILVSLLIAVSVTCFSGCGSSSDQEVIQRRSCNKEEVVTKKDADEKMRMM